VISEVSTKNNWEERSLDLVVKRSKK